MPRRIAVWLKLFVGRFVRSSIFLPFRHEFRDKYIDFNAGLIQQFGGVTHSRIPGNTLGSQRDGDYKNEFEGWWIQREDDFGRLLAEPRIVHDEHILWMVVDVAKLDFPNWKSILQDVDLSVRREFNESAGWVMGHKIRRFVGKG